jgi:aminoglycoside phosphotransferase (APT) family kinase protein
VPIQEGGDNVEKNRFLDTKVVQGTLQGQEEDVGAWLSGKLPNARDVRVMRIMPPPPGSGFSAENYFIDVTWIAGARRHESRFVLRRRSASRQMFPGRDFIAERRVQQMIAELDAAPVPRIIGGEDDPEVLGEHFYVMSFIDGRTPPTHPSYHEAGWLCAMSIQDRRQLWLNGLRDLGRLHRRTLGRSEIEVFSTARDGRSEFAHSLDYWKGHYEAAMDGKPQAMMVELLEWLREHAPAETHRAVCWGDSRIGNALFDSKGRCVGMVDWELFSIGDPIRDLAYWLYTDEHFVYAAGRILDRWPTQAESIAAYEESAGFSVNRRALAFYRIFQGYMIVATLARQIQIRKELGQMAAGLVVDENFTPVSYLQREWDVLCSANDSFT